MAKMTTEQINERTQCVKNTLVKYGCATAKQLVFLIKRDCGQDYTAQAISGVLRTFKAKGLAASSKDVNGNTVYWLAD